MTNTYTTTVIEEQLTSLHFAIENAGTNDETRVRRGWVNFDWAELPCGMKVRTGLWIEPEWESAYGIGDVGSRNVVVGNITMDGLEEGEDPECWLMERIQHALEYAPQYRQLRRECRRMVEALEPVE